MNSRSGSFHPGGSNINLVKNKFPGARLRQKTAVAKPWFWLKGECQTRGLHWQTLVKQLWWWLANECQSGGFTSTTRESQMTVVPGWNQNQKTSLAVPRDTSLIVVKQSMANQEASLATSCNSCSSLIFVNKWMPNREDSLAQSYDSNMIFGKSMNSNSRGIASRLWWLKHDFGWTSILNHLVRRSHRQSLLAWKAFSLEHENQIRRVR